MKKLHFLLFLISFSLYSQVGINNALPNAMLDVAATNQGVLIPRVSLTSTLDNTTVINPQGGGIATSTLIYNSSSAGVSPNNVEPGFYYWNGTAWQSLGGNQGWGINGNSGTGTSNYIGTSDAQSLHFSTNNIQKMTITHDSDPNFDGSVIINPSLYPNSPYRFSVLEDIQDKFGIYSGITNNLSQAVCIETGHANFGGGAGALLNGYYGMIGFGQLYSGFFSGDVFMTNDLTVTGTFYNPSDRRIKSNFQKIDNALGKVLSLNPCRYEKNLNLIDKSPKNVLLKKEMVEKMNRECEPITEFGLIAQELELIFPELVQTSQTSLINDTSSNLKSVNYIGLIPITIKAIQEQQLEIDNLKRENKALQDKIDYILSKLEN